MLGHLSAQLRTLQEARAWPAHHSLWLCIHGGEGNWDDPNSGGNGHYGGLQMTPGWGSMPDGATANTYSQVEQERNAEAEYAKNGYSRTWLQGQWGQTIGPCWGYAAP